MKPHDPTALAAEKAMDDLCSTLSAYLAARGGEAYAHINVARWAEWRLSAVCEEIRAPGYPHRPLAKI